MDYTGKKVLVRAIEAGVYFGTLIEKEGSEVTLENARNIWAWEGANCQVDIAKKGVNTNSSYTRISCVMQKITIMGVCQIIPLEKEAIKNLEGAREWTY